MKKSFFYVAALMLGLAFTATSCSNDDDNEVSAADIDYNSENAPSWHNYMKNVGRLLQTDATNLQAAWTTGGYGDAFINHNGEFTTAKAMAKFLDRLNTNGKLTKTILYNLNPCANEVIATMLGNFQDGSIPGKIQFGSGWWFLDQKDGMEKQMNALSVLGLLSRFVGMLTDSRSFLSYPRHEYFRRTLCNLVGRDVENGEIPAAEMERVNQMIEDISYYNAKKFFQF